MSAGPVIGENGFGSTFKSLMPSGSVPARMAKVPNRLMSACNVASLMAFSALLYFAKFSDQLRLVEVIVGAMSDITRDELYRNLGDLKGRVNVIKARLAFRSFKVVKQRNDSLWV